ncbi:hypothetical protein JXA85_08225 [Candidatus Woesearchaeota archaeon]|nr:hypothetical protein [Candidatus Woesearchaeota archaeon]
MEEDVLKKVRLKFESHDFVVYGTDIIRKELRDTPKHIKYGKNKVRILLLDTYDFFVRKENPSLKYNKLVAALANDYFKEYKLKDGALSKEAIRNDFSIVATATIYQLDIVVSDDERTMLSYKAISSYYKINKRYGLKNPIFKKYSTFKKELAR